MSRINKNSERKGKAVDYESGKIPGKHYQGIILNDTGKTVQILVKYANNAPIPVFKAWINQRQIQLLN